MRDLSTGMTDPTTTRGDIIIRGASALTRLAKAAANDLYTADANDVTTATLSAILDAKIGSTRGMTLARGASTWGSVALPTNNGLLGSNGTDIAGIGGQFSAVVYNSATQSLTDSTITVLSWDSELFDNGAMHSTSSNTSRLTATIAGRYLICGFVTFAANATGMRLVGFGVNGTGNTYTASLFTNTVAGGNTGLPFACVLSLAANDYVEIIGYQTSGGALNVAAGSTVGGCRISIALLAGQ